jgi:hypothetical protein
LLSKRSPGALLTVEKKLSMAALSQQLPRQLMRQTFWYKIARSGAWKRMLPVG